MKLGALLKHKSTDCVTSVTQIFKNNHHSIKSAGLQEPPPYHVKGFALVTLGAVLLGLFVALKEKDQCKPLIVNVVSMPLWMWSVTWQWSNQVPGFPATISTVWKVPGKRSKTSARCMLSVYSVKRGKQKMGNKLLSWGNGTLCIQKNTKQRPSHPESLLTTVLRQNNQGLGSDCYLVGKCLSMEVNSVHVHFVAHSQ